MRTLLSGPFPWLIGGSALFLALMYLWIAGSAVVVDETGGVESAVVTNGGGRYQPLYELWSGYFYTIPAMEGVIEVRCKGGVRKQFGYVTGSIHTKIRVTGGKPCEKVADG